MSFLTTKITSKMIDKVIKKQGQKRSKEMQSEVQSQNYIGYYAFGMEMYGLAKVMFWIITGLVALFLIIGLAAGGDDGIIAVFAGVLMEPMAIFMLTHTKKNSGIVMYSHDSITIYKGNGKMYDFTISGLKRITVQGKYMVYEGFGDVAKVLCMGDGVAAYFNHMNARRPDLMQPLLAYRNVVYMLNQDVEKYNRMRRQ
ncbi:MAG: hypothetical protein IJ274_14745 [Lachnospiraceae bacterium]|nr:hypothetical protein [Lachnospiraceae bacterium]